MSEDKSLEKIVEFKPEEIEGYEFIRIINPVSHLMTIPFYSNSASNETADMTPITRFQLEEQLKKDDDILIKDLPEEYSIKDSIAVYKKIPT